MKSSSGYEIYHNTLSSCLNEVEDYIQSKGYQVGDYFPLINHVSYGQTERTQLEMIKNGKVANTLAIQIYRMESGRYELNCYPVKKFSGGGSTDEGIDLFEDYENIPPQVMEILEKYEESFVDGDYKGLEQAHDELLEIGYTFEAYLDGVAYDLRPVGTKGKTSEEFATGGGIKNLKVGDKYKFKFDNKIYEVVAIEDHLIHLHNTQGMWWDNRKATISVMAKWLKNKSMVKAMATGGGLETYKDLSKETPMVVNDSSPKINKVPEIDLIRTGKVIESPAIRNSKDCYDIFKKFWNENNLEILEQLNVMFLSKANKPLGIYQHSKGGIDGTTMDIEIISAMAVKSLAKGVIVAHNHPSGALVPSEADKQMTKKLINALKLFDISLLDSLIVTTEGYFSLADNGLMS